MGNIYEHAGNGAKAQLQSSSNGTDWTDVGGDAVTLESGSIHTASDVDIKAATFYRIKITADDCMDGYIYMASNKTANAALGTATINNSTVAFTAGTGTTARISGVALKDQFGETITASTDGFSVADLGKRIKKRVLEDHRRVPIRR